MKKYTLRVYPKGGGRSIYRTIEISGDQTLDDLCYVILYSFQFDCDHMYEFFMDNVMYSDNCYICRSIDGEPTTDIELDDLGLWVKQKFLFHYDFGDDWLFVVTVSKIEECSDSVKQITNAKGSIKQYPDWDETEDDWDTEDDSD